VPMFDPVLLASFLPVVALASLFGALVRTSPWRRGPTGVSGDHPAPRNPANRAGWTILEETPVMLVLGRGEERLAVSITGGGGRPTIQYLRMR
jgi:hypothetical protein